MQQAQNTAGTSSSFPAAEKAGDFNVAIVGWAGAVSVNPGGVTDSEGNTYVLAGTSSGQSVTQAIYYANNIKGDGATPNTVSVAFSSSPGNGTADVRVLEYTGNIVTVDNWAGSSGVSTPANSGTAATSTSSLIVGAGAAVSTFTGAPNGSGLPAGLTTRGINSFGDIAMDSNGAVGTGIYLATADVSGGWVMQVVGFSIGGVATTAPTVTGIAPASGSTTGGDSVTITGTNFANGANALFGTEPSGISLQNCVVTSTTNPTTMTCTTPPDNAGPKDLTVVNVDGKLGFLVSAFDYSTNPPTVTSISPATSTSNGGATITVTGTNFASNATVNVGGQLPRGGFGLFGDNVVFNSSTSITFTTPAQPAGLLPNTLPGSPEDVTVFNPTGANAGAGTLPGALTYTLGTGAVNYIQRGDSALSSGSTGAVPVPMPNPQGKGDLNVVIIGWNDVVSQVSQVTDTEGNSYVPALLPSTDGVSLSQVIYYAKNINGDGATNNQITVTFNRSAATPDIRVLEYSGLDPNSPLDQGVGNFGSAPPADSGPCTTTAASELIVAGATVDSQVIGAGPGFTTVDYTFNGNNAEHQITSTIGSSCAAQAQLAAAGWVMQTVSFKAGTGLPPDFSLTANPPTSQTVTAGSNAAYSLTVGALSGFSGTVALACSGLPAGATCGFTPVSPVPVGPVALTISTIGSTPAGTSTVTVTGTSGALNHTAQVTLVVNAGPNFTLTATPTSATIATPGGSATSTISVTATGGFNAAVALACSVSGGGSPAPTCSLSSSSVSPGATSNLTVNTTANTASNLPRSNGIFYALLLPIGGVTLLGAGFSSRRKKLVGILLIGMLIAGFILLASCGGGSSSHTPSGGTPPGTYTVTVTGTSGALSSPTTFTVTVQ